MTALRTESKEKETQAQVHPVHYPWNQEGNPDCKAGQCPKWERALIGAFLSVASTSLALAIFGAKKARKS